MSHRLQALYQKTIDVVHRVSSETSRTARRGVLTPEEVNALKLAQQHLQLHVPKIQSQIQTMQEKVYQGVMNRRAGNDS